MLSFRDTQAIKEIYGFGASFQKHEMYKLQNGEGHMNILNVIDRDAHNRKRRILSHAFSTKNLENWESKITEKVEMLVDQFDRYALRASNKDNTSKTRQITAVFVDAKVWFNYFTVDAIADIALSEKLGLTKSGSDLVKVGDSGEDTRAYRFIEDMHEAGRMKTKVIGTLEWFDFTQGLYTFLSARARERLESGRKFGQIISHLAGRRMQREGDGEGLDDFFSCLLKDKAGKNRVIEVDELRAEANILLDAGSETTAIALTHLLYYLIKTPACYAKLHEEVSAAISGDKIAPYSKVKNLPYLKACIEESLRLSPPLPRGLERITPPEGAKIMGEFIPGNVGVSVPAYVAHRDPRTFPNPEAFMPERWLNNGNIAKMREAFIPFSAGGRACIGRNITMIEQQILMATLVNRFEFALPSLDWKLENEEAFNLWPVELPVRIYQRDVGI
ncbi:cytochrome P450 [Penicillium angulare]|uniref:Cytochrome P450 n=1 Tax=Penicillium angulare TaxID=116970 RepID=A0A9W9K607_9EURO|nr:cytochrome P450 [Penicillium angulare]